MKAISTREREGSRKEESTNVGALTLQPLDQTHRRAGRNLPKAQAVGASEVPEPYRELLVHERDMTRTLERFHGGSIHLELLSNWRTAQSYYREVVLRLDGSNTPVEFGAIKIYLQHLPEPWCSQVLEGYRPLGRILNESGIEYVSRPSAYFRIEADPFIAGALALKTGAFLYGRQNILRNSKGDALAEIVEILPAA